MSTLQTLAAMSLIGYLGFVFISESFNPFKKTHLAELRSRKRFGILIGLLLAACGAVAFFIPTQTFLAKFKLSLGIATIVVAIAVVVVAIRQFFGWMTRRRHSKALQKQTANQLTEQSSTSGKQDKQEELKDKAGITGPVTDTGAEPILASQQTDNLNVEHATIADSHSKDVNGTDKAIELPAVDTDKDTGSAGFANGEADKARSAMDDLGLEETSVKKVDDPVTGELVNDSPDTIDTKQLNPQVIDKDGADAVSVLGDEVPFDYNDGLTEQSAISEYNELHVEDKFFGTGPIHDNEGTAANHNLFEHYTPGTDSVPANDDNLVVADDLFDDIAEVTEVTEVTEASDVNVIETDEPNAGDWPEVADSEIPNGKAILSLQSAMQEVSSDAAQIQDSVNQINTLNRKETYYRTRVEQAQAAYEQAQLAQHEAQSMELKLGEQRLEQEVETRLTIETQLEAKLAELEQTQSRVRTLQADLNERQQIFSDQVDSLEKTRAMARNAALLARRAATAQQQARTEALKERAARERLEVSAKKAVHIARSAISKLAEEERRNRN